MDGKTLVKIVEMELSKRGISKAQFYNNCGISSATFSQWRTGLYEPTQSKIEQIEKCLGINVEEIEKSMSMDAETADILQSIRERQDLRILLHSARDVQASSVYALISQIEKMKEDEN